MQTNAGLSWRWASDPPSEKAVRHAERSLGVTFPPDYRECVKANGGGAPEPSGFRVRVGGDRLLLRSVGLLLNLDLQESENVLETIDALDIRNERPQGLIPIINDGEGNYVCLDYRGDPSGATPTIAYWSRETGGQGEVYPLAGSFSEFLGSLSQGQMN